MTFTVMFFTGSLALNYCRDIVWRYCRNFRFLSFSFSIVARMTFTVLLYFGSLVWRCYRDFRYPFFFRTSIALWKTCCSSTLIAGSLVFSYFRNILWNYFRNFYFFLSIVL